MNSEQRPAIAYYRVSTQRQGQSGLGLDAQRQAVQTYAAGNGLSIVREFTEIETGTSKRTRPQMAAALAAAKDAGGVLLIAKLDRLARNVHFVSGLMESGVEFTAVDMPTANRLTIHIMAAMAEFEAEQISKRTKEALAAAKRRGVKLGAHSHKKPGRGPAVNRAAARKAYRRRIAYIRDLQAQGMGHQAIATRLNAEGYTTRTGKPFHAMTVYRILQRDR